MFICKRKHKVCIQCLLMRNIFLFVDKQDIVAFRGSLEELNNLNEAGRSKLSALRKYIERLDDFAADSNDADVSTEVDSHRQQFSR